MIFKRHHYNGSLFFRVIMIGAGSLLTFATVDGKIGTRRYIAYSIHVVLQTIHVPNSAAALNKQLIVDSV